MTKLLQNLPFYWRLASTTDSEYDFLPSNYSFSLEFNQDFGLLSQVRSDELLTHLETVYSMDYNIGYLQEGYEIAEPYMEDFWSYLVGEVKKFDRTLRILEVGCGGALLLKRLKDIGHQVVGVDPSPLAERAGKKFGIDVSSELLHGDLEIGTFDVIYSMDVLEHAFDATEFLSISKRFLNKGGKIIVSVPDAGPSIERHDISCAMHQHLQYFDISSLKKQLESVGLFDAQVVKAGYGGSLYATATNSELDNRTDQTLEESNPDSKLLEKIMLNLRNVNDVIQGELDKGKSIAAYAPLRALPYLSEIPGGLESDQIRFIDDTKAWHNKKFDGTNIFVENILDLKQRPTDSIFVFSLTFEDAIIKKIKQEGIPSRVISLGNLLT